MQPKQRAALHAIQFVQHGQLVGLGTGSTAYFAIQGLGEKVREGLQITAVGSSAETERLAREAGIPLVGFEDIEQLDMYIDGADEVDDDLCLIKGGGGALLREKLLAHSSRRFIVIVDESKMVGTLGRFPLPVEIVPFAWPLTRRHIEKLGCTAQLRQKDNSTYITDNGNFILDCAFEKIKEPAALEQSLHRLPGVVECGLFVGMAERVVIAGTDGSIRERQMK